jgi:hypothetical protein
VQPEKKTMQTSIWLLAYHLITLNAIPNSSTIVPAYIHTRTANLDIDEAAIGA